MCKPFLGCLIAAAILLAVPTNLSGQTVPDSHDLGSWVSVHVNKSWGKPYMAFRAEHRSNQSLSNTECWFLLASGGYRLTDWLSSDASYELWNIAGAQHHRLVLTASEALRQGNLSVTLREKYEYTFAPGGGTYSNLRVRLRAQYAIPDSAFRPYMMAEVFTWGAWKRSLYYAGTDIVLGRNVALDLFYLYHLQQGGPYVHTLGVGLVLNL